MPSHDEQRVRNTHYARITCNGPDCPGTVRHVDGAAGQIRGHTRGNMPRRPSPVIGPGSSALADQLSGGSRSGGPRRLVLAVAPGAARAFLVLPLPARDADHPSLCAGRAVRARLPGYIPGMRQGEYALPFPDRRAAGTLLAERLGRAVDARGLGRADRGAGPAQRRRGRGEAGRRRPGRADERHRDPQDRLSAPARTGRGRHRGGPVRRRLRRRPAGPAVAVPGRPGPGGGRRAGRAGPEGAGVPGRPPAAAGGRMVRDRGGRRPGDRRDRASRAALAAGGTGGSPRPGGTGRGACRGARRCARKPTRWSSWRCPAGSGPWGSVTGPSASSPTPTSWRC